MKSLAIGRQISSAWRSTCSLKSLDFSDVYLSVWVAYLAYTDSWITDPSTAIPDTTEDVMVSVRQGDRPFR